MAEPTSDAALALPHPALRPFVAAYHGYRMHGYEPGVHAGLPSRTVTLVISLDDPVDMCRMADPGQVPGAFQALIGGLHDRPVGIRHDGDQHGLQLDVTPLGARALLGMPAAALAAQVVELSEVAGPGAASLPDRLRSLPDWPARFAELDRVLLSWRREGTPPADEVLEAWRVLAERHGAVGVAELADRVGWSRRHLGGRFRDEFGLSPKVAGRVMRFERARRLLVADTSSGLADVAATAGYADQAHLTREWRRLAGSTPSAWRRGEELPFVQDPDALLARP